MCPSVPIWPSGLACFKNLLNNRFPSQYLAILFFQNDYHKSALPNLPGVVNDEKELTEVLKNYQKKVIRNSEDILKDLGKILQDCSQKEFERIHFHFSGRISLSPCDFCVSPRSKSFFFFFLGTFIQLWCLLGPGFGPVLDNIDIRSASLFVIVHQNL